MATRGGGRLPSFPVGVHLAAYGLALVLPVLVFSALVLDRYSRAEHQRSEAHALSAARDLASSVDRNLAAMITRLSVLANAPAIERGDFTAFDEYVTAARQDDGSRLTLVAIRDGSREAVVIGRLGETAVIGASDELIDKSVAERTPFVSNLRISADGVSDVAIGVPVVRDGEVSHVLVANYRPMRLQRLLRKSTLDAPWMVTVVDGENRIIARWPDQKKYIGGSIGPEGANLARLPEAVVKTTDVDNVEVYQAHAHTALATWSVAVALPVGAVESPLNEAWRMFSLAGGALLGLSVLLAMVFGSALARPIQSVARSARALGRGEPVVRSQSIVDEVNDVAAALEAAASELKQSEAAVEAANETMRIALRAGRMGTFEVDLETGLMQSSSERLDIFGLQPDTFDGRAETLDRMIHPDDLDVVAQRRADAACHDTTYETEYRIIRPDGAIRWVLTRAEIRTDAGRRRVFGVTMDITGRKLAEKRHAIAAQQASRQLRELEALYASAPIGLALFDRDLRYLRINEAMARMHGVPRDDHFGRTSRQILGAIADEVEPLLMQVLKTGASLINREMQGETPREPGVLRYFNAHYYPLLDEGGHVAGVGLIVEDITEDKRAAERQTLLVRELRHRANNMLAVIQSVARRSLTGEGSLSAARTNFLERLQALARAHNMLTDSDWRGVSLEELVRLELEGLVDRAVIEGPPIVLDSSPAQTFALVLHELAVNAVKHGALSTDAGRIEVTWSIEGVGADTRFRFRWQERSGPIVTPPDRRGFGTELLERAIIEDFDKPARIEFLPDGLLFQVDVPYAIIKAR